jgi:hypothetical protein
MIAAHPLVYRCPHCGTAVEVQPQASEQVVICPSPACGKPFQAELPAAHPEAGARLPPDTQPLPAQPVAPAPAPAPPVEPTLPPEEVLEVVRVSMWRRYPLRCLAYLVVTVASAVGAIIALTQNLNLVAAIAAVVLLVTLVRFVPWWLRMRNTTLTITTRRVILEKGVWHREASEFERGDLIDVRVSQSGLMRLFNVGDLVISSDVDSKKQSVLMAVPDPATVAEHLRDLNVQHQPPPAAPAPQKA